jgi:hypothetical protein
MDSDGTCVFHAHTCDAGGAPDAVVGQDPAQRGWVVMHRGSDVHQADLITAGHRINLVVWANEEEDE